MDEDDDWKLWRQAINPMATDFLRGALEDREAFLQEADPVRRKRLARKVMSGFLRAAEAMGTDEISELAFGLDLNPDDTHADHLRGLADRIDLLSKPFQLRDASDYIYSPRAVANELRYLADGDQPRALRPSLREANRSAHKEEIEHWARALAWVQFLKQGNKRIGDCRSAVADAYGVGVEGVTRDWLPRVAEVLGDNALREIERAAKPEPPSFKFATEQQGLDTLKADGAAYQAFLYRKAGRIAPIKGNRSA